MVPPAINVWDYLGNVFQTEESLEEGPCCCKIDGNLTKRKPTAGEVKKCLSAKAVVRKRFAYPNPFRENVGLTMLQEKTVPSGGVLPTERGLPVYMDYTWKDDGDCPLITFRKPPSPFVKSIIQDPFDGPRSFDSLYSTMSDPCGDQESI